MQSRAKGERKSRAIRQNKSRGSCKRCRHSKNTVAFPFLTDGARRWCNSRVTRQRDDVQRQVAVLEREAVVNSDERDKLNDGQDWPGAEAAFDKGVAAIGPQTVGTDADLDVFAKLANEPQKHAHLLSADIYGVESADTLFVNEDGLERADQADVLLAERLLLQYENFDVKAKKPRSHLDVVLNRDVMQEKWQQAFDALHAKYSEVFRVSDGACASSLWRGWNLWASR